MLTVVADEIFKLWIIGGFLKSREQSKKDQLVRLVTKHLQHTASVTSERFKLQQREQAPMESIPQSIAGLYFGKTLEEIRPTNCWATLLVWRCLLV